MAKEAKSETLNTDLKHAAFIATAAAIGTLDKRTDQLDVLRAVANYYGIATPMELPR